MSPELTNHRVRVATSRKTSNAASPNASRPVAPLDGVRSGGRFGLVGSSCEMADPVGANFRALYEQDSAPFTRANAWLAAAATAWTVLGSVSAAAFQFTIRQK